MNQQKHLAEIQKIFNSFDLNNTGRIELAELKKVAEALGDNLSEVELREIVQKLDINEDGLISLDEFKLWWLHGQKGELSQLVFLRAKSIKLANSFLNKFKQAGVDLAKFNQDGKVDKVQIEINFGKDLKQEIKLDLSFCHRGQKFKQKFVKLKNYIPSINKQSLNFCLLLPTEFMDKFRDQFLQLEKKFINLLPFHIENIEENQFFSIKVLSLQKYVALHLQLGSQLAQFFSNLLLKFDQIDDNLGNQLGFFGEASLHTNFSITELIEETNLIQTLLKGLSVKLNVQVPNSITKKFREVLQANHETHDDSFAYLLIVLLKSLKLKINLQTPQKIESFFKKLGISQLILECPSFKNLLELLALLMNAQESKKNPADPTKYLYEFLKILKTHVNSRIQLYIHRKQTLFHIKTDFPEASKIFQVIYNQL